MQRSLLATLLTLLAPALTLAGQQEKTITFTKDSADKVPAGWKVAKTGKGDGSAWSVVADDSAPSKTGYALMQTAASPGSVFNLCVLEDTNFLDVEVMVQFKAVKGEADQGGGIAWRLQDADNYYVARMNPLEDNLRLYKVVGGKRTELARKEGLKVAVGTWHDLKIKHVGMRIEVFLDGVKYLDMQDDTFQKVGKVGLWTKADAQTRFDRLVVRPLGKQK